MRKPQLRKQRAQALVEYILIVALLSVSTTVMVKVYFAIFGEGLKSLPSNSKDLMSQKIK